MSKGRLGVEARGILAAPPVQHLEFLAEMGGMQQLEQRELALAEVGGVCGCGGRNGIAGVMNEKRLL